MTSHRCQHKLTFNMNLKMKPNKEHIRHYLLFCFHQKKSAIDVQRELFVTCMTKKCYNH